MCELTNQWTGHLVVDATVGRANKRWKCTLSSPCSSSICWVRTKLYVAIHGLSNWYHDQDSNPDSSDVYIPLSHLFDSARV